MVFHAISAHGHTFIIHSLKTPSKNAHLDLRHFPVQHYPKHNPTSKFLMYSFKIIYAIFRCDLNFVEHWIKNGFDTMQNDKFINISITTALDQQPNV